MWRRGRLTGPFSLAGERLVFLVGLVLVAALLLDVVSVSRPQDSCISPALPSGISERTLRFF